MARYRLLFVALAVFLVGRHAAATTITFDDIATGGGIVFIPNGYQGLNWSNFAVEPGALNVPSGYNAGMISAPNVAFNGGGNNASFSSATPFTLTSAYLTGAWNDGLRIDVVGFNGALPIGSVTLFVSSTSPTLQNFNWANLTEVVFLVSGGTHNPNYTGGQGTQFALDNLVVNGTPVPEPASLLLLGTGLVSVSARRWRNRRQRS